MAALTAAGRDLSYQGDLEDNLREGDVIASDILYPNSFVAFAAAGGIQPVVADLAFAGVCTDLYDNSSGALGDLIARYIAWGVIRVTNITEVFARTDEGVPVYSATDNPEDLTDTAAGATLVGTCVRFISASEVDVELAGPGS